MKIRIAYVLALLAVAGLGLRFSLKPRHHMQPNPSRVQTGTASSAPVQVEGGRKPFVVVPTGQARMSNAVRCMSFILGLADKVSPQDKTTIITAAGGIFFNDSLMAKMSHGCITVTTNELFAGFSNAVAQVYSNHIPADLSAALQNPKADDGNWLASLPAIFQHETNLRAHPDTALAFGFYNSFRDRNNLHISVDNYYNWMTQAPQLAQNIQVVESAMQEVGVTDASQSDVKQMCLGLCEERMSVYTLYGPQTDAPEMERFNRYSDAMNQIMQWRLVNMFGLDEQTAQTLVQKLSGKQIDGFNHADLQPPAFIQ